MANALSASGRTKFTRWSMADCRLAGIICSQLKIEVALRGAKTSGRKYYSLDIIMTIKLLPREFKLTSGPVFTKLFTIKLSDCQTVKANIIGNNVI